MIYAFQVLSIALGQDQLKKITVKDEYFKISNRYPRSLYLLSEFFTKNLIKSKSSSGQFMEL